MPRIEINYDAKELRKLIMEDLERRLSETNFAQAVVHIKVKSTQNYKAEWEEADFQARVLIP
jgi:hypothetical protein